MAYAQSASNGTLAGANVTTLSCALPNDIGHYGLGVPIPPGLCLVVDVMWELDSPGASTLTVTDSWGQTYTAAFVSSLGSGTENWASYYILNPLPLFTTIIITCNVPMAQVSMAAHEYNNVTALDVVGHGAGNLSSPYIQSVTTTHSVDMLHTFAAVPGNFSPAPAPYANVSNFYIRQSLDKSIPLTTCDMQVSRASVFSAQYGVFSHALEPKAYGAVIAFKVIENPLTPDSAWLQIVEPVIGLTDQSQYLHIGDGQGQHSVTRTLLQRGTAEIPLIIKAGDPYAPTEGAQIFLYDQTPAGQTLIFAGNIEKVTITWLGTGGAHIATLSCVSFEKAFDTLKVSPRSYYAQTAASIFTDLYDNVANGVPIKLGTIDANFVINQLQLNWATLSDAFNNLAVAAQCTWGIDYSDLSVYFAPPTVLPSPYTLHVSQIAFDSSTWQTNSQDYRNRQILRISPSAFGLSSEQFPVSSVPFSVTLMRPADTVVSAYLTKNTQNFATGTFSDQPADGDTITIGYPQSGSIYNWAPNAPYRVGQAIVDPDGNVQIVTTQGTSGGSAPSWNSTVGGNTGDGPGSPEQPDFNGAVVWTNNGPSGAGGLNVSVYTFRGNGVVDNTAWGEVEIGIDLGTTVWNLVQAINNNQTQNPQVAGNVFSWPTWENPLVNAEWNGGSGITVRNKAAGQGYISALSANCANFSWSASETGGGTTKPNTYDLQVAANGSSNTANVYYSPGSAVVALASYPSGINSLSGYYLAIGYQRTGGDCIIVEDTNQVWQRSALENGTGKYQQLATQTDVTSNTLGLQYALSILRAYSVIPTSYSFIAWKPGLAPGQIITIDLADDPANLAALVNGTWVIQEVTAELIPAQPWMDQSQVIDGGHYRYTVTLINDAQVVSYLAFWQQLGSGGGGGTQIGVIGAVVAPGSNGVSAHLRPANTGFGPATGVTTAPFTVPVSIGTATPDASQGENLLILTAANTLTDANGNRYVNLARPMNYATPSGVYTQWTLVVQNSLEAAWNSGTAYVVGNAVSLNGVNYVSILNGTNHRPDTSPTFWTALSGYSVVFDPTGGTYKLNFAVSSPASPPNTQCHVDFKTDWTGNTFPVGPPLIDQPIS